MALERMVHIPSRPKTFSNTRMRIAHRHQVLAMVSWPVRWMRYRRQQYCHLPALVAVSIRHPDMYVWVDRKSHRLRVLEIHSLLLVHNSVLRHKRTIRAIVYSWFYVIQEQT